MLVPEPEHGHDVTSFSLLLLLVLVEGIFDTAISADAKLAVVI